MTSNTAVPSSSARAIASSVPKSPETEDGAASASSEPTGNTLTPPSAELPRWRNAFAELAAGRGEEPLRVLWFGDSHTAADYLPHAVRKALSGKVAIGGPGYLGLGVPGYRHGLAKVWSDGNIEVSPHPPARRTREDDGIFGLGGTRATLRDNAAFVTVRPNLGVPAMPMECELTYRLTTAADALRVTVGEQRIELDSAKNPSGLGDLRQHRFTAMSDATIEIRAIHGRPQLFGVVMETQRPGLVIDTLGINGARFATLLSWEEETLAHLVAARQPRLLIIAYGTNEVFDAEPVSRHARKLEQVVERLRRGAPEADCVVMGPTDAAKGGEATHARVVALDTAERATAEQIGCAYFSPFELMAAAGGFEVWARQDPPLALPDGIHLTARGYARLGDVLAARLQAVDAPPSR